MIVRLITEDLIVEGHSCTVESSDSASRTVTVLKKLHLRNRLKKPDILLSVGRLSSVHILSVSAGHLTRLTVTRFM